MKNIVSKRLILISIAASILSGLGGCANMDVTAKDQVWQTCLIQEHESPGYEIKCAYVVPSFRDFDDYE